MNIARHHQISNSATDECLADGWWVGDPTLTRDIAFDAHHPMQQIVGLRFRYRGIMDAFNGNIRQTGDSDSVASGKNLERILILI